MGKVLNDGLIAMLNNSMPAMQVAELGTKLDDALGGVVTPFHGIATLTAAAAGTAVPIVADAEVPAGKKIYVTGYRVIVSGATAWADATATKVVISDTNDTPVVVTDIAKAGLGANAIINTVGGTNQTLGANIISGAGLTATKGLQIKADAHFGAGSDIKVVVFGVIK